MGKLITFHTLNPQRTLTQIKRCGSQTSNGLENTLEPALDLSHTPLIVRGSQYADDTSEKTLSSGQIGVDCLV